MKEKADSGRGKFSKTRKLTEKLERNSHTSDFQKETSPSLFEGQVSSSEFRTMITKLLALGIYFKVSYLARLEM